MYFSLKNDDMINKLDNTVLKNIFSSHSDYLNIETVLPINTDISYINSKYSNYFNNEYFKQNSFSIISENQQLRNSNCQYRI